MDPFKSYLGEKTYSSPISGYYFDKLRGVLLTTAPIDSSVHQDFFQRLQKNINEAVEPLIQFLTEAYQVAMSETLLQNVPVDSLPTDHIVNRLSYLITKLAGNQPFLSTDKIKQPHSCDQLAIALSIVTQADEDDCHALLLKINACKNKYIDIDSWTLFENKKFKPPFVAVQNFLTFQLEIEDAISNIHKCNEQKLCY